MDRHNELMKMLADAQPDFVKFYDKGNKAAGTRVRKAMQELKQAAQNIRQEVTNLKNA